MHIFRTILGNHQHVLIAVLAAGAVTASVVTFAAESDRTLTVYTQYDGPGIGNFERPVPGVTVAVTPPCDQPSIVTDAKGYALFTGCRIDAPELMVRATEYPREFRPVECKRSEPKCQPTHDQTVRAGHPNDDIFVFERLVSLPTPVGKPVPIPADDGSDAPVIPDGLSPAVSTVPPASSSSAGASEGSSARSGTASTSASPSPAAVIKAGKPVVAATQSTRTNAGFIAVTLLLILGFLALVRSVIRFRRS